MSETKFQLNDEVEWCGCVGTVISTVADAPLSVRVTFHELDKEFRFTSDGRREDWHKEPSLKLIERPKKKVTKTMYQAIYEGAGARVVIASFIPSKTHEPFTVSSLLAQQ